MQNLGELEKVKLQARKVLKRFKMGSIRNLAVRASNFKPKPEAKKGIVSFFQNLLQTEADQSIRNESREVEKELHKQNELENVIASEVKGKLTRPVESVIKNNNFMLKELELGNSQLEDSCGKQEKFKLGYCSPNNLKTKKKRANNSFKKEHLHRNLQLNDEEIYQIMEQEKTKKDTFESKRIFKNSNFPSKTGQKAKQTRPVDKETKAIICRAKRLQLSPGSLSQRIQDFRNKHEDGKRSRDKIQVLLDKRDRIGEGDSDDPDLIKNVREWSIIEDI